MLSNIMPLNPGLKRQPLMRDQITLQWHASRKLCPWMIQSIYQDLWFACGFHEVLGREEDKLYPSRLDFLRLLADVTLHPKYTLLWLQSRLIFPMCAKPFTVTSFLDLEGQDSLSPRIWILDIYFLLLLFYYKLTSPSAWRIKYIISKSSYIACTAGNCGMHLAFIPAILRLCCEYSFECCKYYAMLMRLLLYNRTCFKQAPLGTFKTACLRQVLA